MKRTIGIIVLSLILGSLFVYLNVFVEFNIISMTLLVTGLVLAFIACASLIREERRKRQQRDLANLTLQQHDSGMKTVSLPTDITKLRRTGENTFDLTTLVKVRLWPHGAYLDYSLRPDVPVRPGRLSTITIEAATGLVVNGVGMIRDSDALHLSLVREWQDLDVNPVVLAMPDEYQPWLSRGEYHLGLSIREALNEAWIEITYAFEEKLVKDSACGMRTLEG